MEDAFFPLHESGEGVFYSWEECVKKFIWCVKWEHQEVIFRFDDKEVMQCFYDKDFGLRQRPRP